MRKISANYIFSPHTGFLKNAIVLLDDNGKVIDLRPGSNPAREEAGTEFYNGIICPGFINSHCHLELSHLKGKIPESVGLDQFIYSVVTRRQSEKSEIHKAILDADDEMKREGIVAVGDISNREDSFDVKSKSNIHYHTFIEIFNMVNREALSTFNKGMELYRIAREKYNLSVSVVPHAPYSVSEKLFELFRTELRDTDNRFSIHNQETRYENEFISNLSGPLYEVFRKLGMEKGDSKKRNVRSMEYLLGSIPSENPLILVHNTHTGPEDILNSNPDLTRTFFCLCPNSNLYISSELPGSYLPDHYPDNVCIGTDSLSSNHRLSVIEELKTLQEHHRHLSLDTLLKFATLNGARSLGLEAEIGSFETGKTPGVNLIEYADLQNLKLLPGSKIKKLV